MLNWIDRSIIHSYLVSPQPVQIEIDTKHPILSDQNFAAQFVNLPTVSKKIHDLQLPEKVSLKKTHPIERTRAKSITMMYTVQNPRTKSLAKKNTIERLKILGNPLSEEELSALLDKVKKFQKILKAGKFPPYPLLFRVSIEKKSGYLGVYELENKTKDIFFTIIDNQNRFDKGAYKQFYRAWLIRKKPKLVAYAISELTNADDLKIAQSEETVLKLCLGSGHTPKLYKCAYFSDDSLPHTQQVLIMKYYPSTLLKKINQPEAEFFADQSKLKYALMVAQAIGFLHKEETIHRDLKLDNILIDKHGNIRLCDFGASFKAPSLKDCFLLRGTPQSFSPETMDGIISKRKKKEQESKWTEKYSYAQDIWALGCLLWNIFAFEQTPWQARINRVLKHFKEAIRIDYQEAKSQIEVFHKNVPDKLKQRARYLVWRMLHINPLERPSIQEVIAELQDMLINAPRKPTYELFVQFSFNPSYWRLRYDNTSK